MPSIPLPLALPLPSCAERPDRASESADARPFGVSLPHTLAPSVSYPGTCSFSSCFKQPGHKSRTRLADLELAQLT